MPDRYTAVRTADWPWRQDENAGNVE